MRKIFVTAIAAALVLWSCKKDDPIVLDMGYDYFPVAIGTWVEYQVDSLWRDDQISVLDSVSYRLLERIEEHYIDPAGRPANRIMRYVKDENDNWVVRDVWTSTRNNMAAEKTEENMRRLKLSFPVREGRRWDSNIYNTEDELEVAHREAHEPWQVNVLSFDSTVVVRNTLPANQVERRDLEERYAKHVGLVEKHWAETNTQQDSGVIQIRGFEMSMVVVAYGTD